MTLTLYTHPMSRGRIARWMLEEVGEPYDTVLDDWTDKPAAPPGVAARRRDRRRAARPAPLPRKWIRL